MSRGALQWPDELAAEKRREYREYMSSAQWSNIREDMIRLRGETCERCGLQPGPKFLEVHHKTYDNFRSENPSDLEVLCRECHDEADRERRLKKIRNMRRKAARTRYRNGLHTFVSKVYGRDTADRNMWAYKDEFDRWLEGQWRERGF